MKRPASLTWNILALAPIACVVSGYASPLPLKGAKGGCAGLAHCGGSVRLLALVYNLQFGDVGEGDVSGGEV